MSKFSDRDPPSPSSSQASPPPSQTRHTSFQPPARDHAREMSPAASAVSNYNTDGASSQARVGRERAVSSSRPMSMVQTYQPPLMDVNEDTLPELQPIFTFLNSHGNKLYQEGYFLKLDDQNTRRLHPSPLTIFSTDQVQRVKQTRTELGRNVLPSSWERFFRYGMPRN
jgi:CCR4-NOT transcriptional complex subunit CAF120